LRWGRRRRWRCSDVAVRRRRRRWRCYDVQKNYITTTLSVQNISMSEFSTLYCDSVYRISI